MDGDLDDTRLVVPSTPEGPAGPDVASEDTVVRGSRSTPGATPDPVDAPPALVEPPPAVARPLPTVVDDPEAAAAQVPDPAPVPEPEAASTAYLVRLANGAEIVVDGPVYFGRKPRAPRIHSGRPPRLVTFPSPLRELSATHLELGIMGGALVATDLRSTNGTVVTLPRSAPRTLIRGESTVVVPGTRIDLGEGAIVDVLGLVVDGREVAS